MSIERVLKKEGIEIVEKLDTLTVNNIASNIANLLTASFPNLNLNQNDIFMRISRLNMYYAKLPNGISAKYFYKNTSIYFDYNLSKDELTDVAVHECIHYLQEKRDKHGDILKLGLCDYTDASLPGVGLNEAAVQLMAAKALNLPSESVKYFDISLHTNTPMYYPLECTLINQMAYLIGEDALFDSTFYANNNFKSEFISLTSEKAFYTIQKNIDLLIETQEKLNTLYSYLDIPDVGEGEVKKISKEIDTNKAKIKELFLNTQKIIFTSYFDNAINLTYSSNMIERYRNKLYLFKNLIGYSDGDTSYNDYYVDKMEALEKRYDINPSEFNSLAIVKKSFFSILISKLKLLFGLNAGTERVK